MDRTIKIKGDDADGEFQRYAAMNKLYSFVWDWEQILRSHDKHGDGKPVAWGDVRDEYYRLKNEAAIPDDVWN